MNKRLLAIRSEHRDIFNMVTQVQHLAYRVIPLGRTITADKVSKPVERYIIALFVQVYRLHCSVIRLCKAGLDIESLIILRSLMETAAYLLFICEKDHDERIKYYRHSVAMSEYTKFMKYLETYPEDKDRLNVKFFEDANKDAINYFRNKHGLEKTIKEIKKDHALKPNDAAQSVFANGMLRHYQMIHREASRIAHGEKILEYIGYKGGQGPILTVGPSGKWIRSALQTAAIFVCLCMEHADPLMGDTFKSDIEETSSEVLKVIHAANIKLQAQQDKKTKGTTEST